MCLFVTAGVHRLEKGSGALVEPTVELDLETFDAFFSNEYPRVVALLTATTGQRAVAEELAQEAMVRAHLRWGRISRYEKPGAWVRRVALNLASNLRARRQAEARAMQRLGTQVLPLQSLEGGPGDDVWSLVRRLPKRQAAAVALHYLEDRSVAEVASALGCAEGTAKAHLHKGRANLARMLDTEEI